MIKVLMLGWEFPPHISGGLGVACEGLTSALIASGEAQVLFVIPKAVARHEHNGLDLRGANTVSVPVDPLTSKESKVNEDTNAQDDVFQVREADALLSPYQAVDGSNAEFLVRWNAFITDPGNHVFQKKSATENNETRTYEFDGGYGHNLLREVDKYARVILSLVGERDFDVIHAHDWMTFPAALAAKRATGKPLVIHVHATEFDRAGEAGSDLVYDIERQAITICDKVITVSRLTKQILMDRYGADPARVSVVHNGTTANQTHPVPTAVHPLGEQLITFLGRVTFQKGPEYFVDAAEKVLKEFPAAHFVLAGAGDALPGMINRVIAKRISANFHFTGFLTRKDVTRLLSFTRVYVMPSVSEPFGLTALEAIQAGVPTIISRQSGVGEITRDVIKVDFWDTDALAQAICGVLRYPLLAQTMKHNALRNVTTISWTAAANKVLDIYYALVKHAGRRSPSIL